MEILYIEAGHLPNPLRLLSQNSQPTSPNLSQPRFPKN